MMVQRCQKLCSPPPEIDPFLPKTMAIFSAIFLIIFPSRFLIEYTRREGWQRTVLVFPGPGAMANGALVSGYAGLLVNLSSDATNHPLLGSRPATRRPRECGLGRRQALLFVKAKSFSFLKKIKKWFFKAFCKGFFTFF